MTRYFLIVFSVLLSYSSQAQFVNSTLQANLSHSHHSTNTLGGGVLFFDANNDGWEDIVMTGGNEDDALYINNADGTFTDLSNNMAHNRGKNVQTSSCAAADFNRDGLTDLFFGTLNADEPNIMLQNIGDNTFLNVSIPAGMSHEAQTMGTTFLDYNHDGWLDIYVLNYVKEDKYIRDDNNDIIGYEHDCFENFLYRNDGNMEFTEVSVELGLLGTGCTLAAATVPYRDNPFGLYVVHDFGEWVKPNEFLIFDSIQNSFTDIAPDLGLDIGLYGMGLGIGDFDGDQDLDLYISNIAHNYLMENKNIKYVDVAVELGVDNTIDLDNNLFSTSWANFFWDYNNDEKLDLYVVNGHIPVADFLENSRRDNNKMYQKIDGGYFDISEESGLDYDHVNRGASLGDYNNDGLQDIVVATTRPGGDAVLPELNYQLYENNIVPRSYAEVKLKGVQSNIEGYGSMIYLYSGRSKQMRYVYAGGVHASQNSTTMHFGLSTREQIDSIEVVWPSGTIDKIIAPPISQKLLITEGMDVADIMGCMDPDNKLFNTLATINAGCAATSVSTDDITDQFELEIRPNPADHFIQLEWNSEVSETIKSIEVWSMEGIKMMSVDVSNIQSVQIDVSDLAAGIYWIKGLTKDKRHFRQLFSKIH